MAGSYLREVERKLIHTSSLWMGFVIYFCPPLTAAVIFAIVLAGLLIFELARWHPATRQLVPAVLTRTLRAHESGAHFSLTGASYVVLSGLIAVLLFPQVIAITALAIMSIGDSAAALVGRAFGGRFVTRKFWGKSAEGSAAFVLAAFIGVLSIGALLRLPPDYLAAGLVACLAGAFAEALASPLKLDDNLTITLGAGSAMWFYSIL